MSKIASEADFLQCDVNQENIPTSSMLLFSTKSQWIARIRMDKINSQAYCLAFKKLFEKCKVDHPHFELCETLAGIIVD